MTFLNPIALLGLFLVSLPVVIHLLVRRRGQRHDFPSLKFLRETPSFKLYPRRLRQPLLLALRAAAILLLVLGLARPFFTAGAETHAVTRFILLDASLSMKTRGRAEAAREQARAIVNLLASGERASVISFSSEATVLSELTADRESLLAAIQRYRPEGGRADYGAGFAEVMAQLRREPPAEAVADLVSDFQRAGLEEQAEVIRRAATPFRVVAHPVGSEVERNAFLADEAVEKSPRGIELSSSEIISERDGRSGARQRWTIDAADGTRPGIEWHTEANGQLTGRLTALGPDDFDADDERFFAVTPPRESRALLIEDHAESGLYLRAALEAGAGGASNFVLDAQPRLPESAADLAPYSLVVVTLGGAAREEEVRTLAEYARSGGAVWMCLGRDADAASWSVAASALEDGRALPFESVARRNHDQPLTFGALDADAPPLHSLDDGALAALRAVRAREAYLVKPRSAADTLIRWSDGTPALIYARAGAGTIMLLGTSLERSSSELGLSPAFPALASSILRWAARETNDPPSRVVGEAVRLPIASDAEVRITNAEGRVSVTRARELVRRSTLYFGEPGIYRLEFAGLQQFLAFNAPGLESERALAAGDELKQLFPARQAAGAGDSREATERSGSAWRYFLAAAFLLMIAELFAALRRPKVAEG